MTSWQLSKSDLHGYQEHAIGHLLLGRETGIFLSPGLGKTIIGLTAVTELSDGRGWIVICPLRVMHVWIAEIQKWEHTRHLTHMVLHGPNKDEQLRQKADVYLMNFEGIPWLQEKLKRSRGRDAPFSHLIVDESQRLKDPSTNRWKKFKTMTPMFGYRAIMSGTPCGGGGLEGLWSQHYILDQGAKFGTEFKNYRDRFFTPRDYEGYQYDLRPGAEEKIWTMAEPRCLSMRSVDHLNMPDLVRNEIHVQLPPKARSQYEFLEDEFFIKLENDKYVISNTAATTGLKLRQISQGGIYDDMARWHVMHEEKLNALSALVDELQGTPLLVLYQFNGELEQILKRFPNAVTMNGDTKPSEQKTITDAWNNDEIAMMAAHPRTISLGQNMQYGSAYNICWYCPTWSLEEYIQTEARMWRQGQENTVVVHHIITERTVDLAVMRSIRRKDETQVALLNALKEYDGGRNV